MAPAAVDRPAGWRIGCVGLFLFVFAIVALTGPGRIDIVDGQTRYEVARSLVDHGDHVIRDPDVWFGVFPGRDGQLFTTYRFPQTAAGVVAIIAADATGPASEGRRHFFFALIGAVAGAILAIAYAAWFRRLGHGTGSALAWGAAGIFFTPAWFYATSTFDDIFGTVAVVVALVVSYGSRTDRPVRGAIVAGLLMALAFNCKQPLGIFVLPVMAAILDPTRRLKQQAPRIAFVAGGLLLGILAYKAYDLYKFPPGAMAANAELLARYAAPWPGNPGIALLVLLVSPAASVLLYFPAMPVSVRGVRIWWRSHRLLVAATLAAFATFVLFIATISFFKGDPAWGPRYLTPVFAVLWLLTPAAIREMRRGIVVALLGCAFIVQLLSLATDPHRLYIELRLHSAFGASQPQLYFHPAVSHLINRPREIVEVATTDGSMAKRFTPAPAPTFAFPVIDFVDNGPEAVKNYHVLNSFRPWWLSQQYLPETMRPVRLAPTAALLTALMLIGLVLQVGSVRRAGARARTGRARRVRRLRPGRLLP